MNVAKGFHRSGGGRTTIECMRLLTHGSTPLLLALLMLLSWAAPARADDEPTPASEGGPPAEPAPVAPPPTPAPAEVPTRSPEGSPEAAPEGEDKPAAAVEPEEDVIVMKGGVIWRGRVILEDAKVVVLERVSRSGGIGRITFERSEVQEIRRGAGTSQRVRTGPRIVRDEWFLLRSGGRIIGTRHLELWSDRTKSGPGFRLEESVRFFAQGPHLPATLTKRTEIVDLRFFPRLLVFREVGEAGTDGVGPRRDERTVSGNVVDGVWRGSALGRGPAQRYEVEVGSETRGRLGFREFLLRQPRAVRLHDAQIIEPAIKGLVSVRAGFASVSDSESKFGQRGHEFHWEEGPRRLVSYFDEETQALQEEIAEGVVALPVSKAQAEAADGQARSTGGDTDAREVRLAEAGIALTAPDPVWTWKLGIASPGNTGWRVLGRMDNRVLLSDVRVEWHPKGADAPQGDAQVEAWLVRRLRGASPNLRVLEARRALPDLADAWRLSLAGTLKQESVRTIAVVVDRPRGRVVLLLAAPASAWEQVRPALDRLVSSIRLL